MHGVGMGISEFYPYTTTELAQWSCCLLSINRTTGKRRNQMEPKQVLYVGALPWAPGHPY